MNILSVDTATRGMSVAIFSDSNLLVIKSHDNMRDQASMLIPLIVEALDEAKMDFIVLDALVVAIGPGSFTGIRVGLSAMQGIALAANKPLVGISNFDIYATQAEGKDVDKLLVALESHRKEAFCQVYDAFGQCLGEPFQIEAESICQHLSTTEDICAVGNAATMLEELSANTGYQVQDAQVSFKDENSAQILGQIFLKMLSEKSIDELTNKHPAIPFYIRPPDVTFPKKRLV